MASFNIALMACHDVQVLEVGLGAVARNQWPSWRSGLLTREQETTPENKKAACFTGRFFDYSLLTC